MSLGPLQHYIPDIDILHAGHLWEEIFFPVIYEFDRESGHCMCDEVLVLATYDAFLTSKYILLTPCFLALYRGPNHSIRPHFVHILPPTPTWHGKAKSHLIETQFYMLWVWKSPKSRCCSEKKCNKIFEAPFSKLYRHSILKKKIL